MGGKDKPNRIPIGLVFGFGGGRKSRIGLVGILSWIQNENHPCWSFVKDNDPISKISKN